MTGRRPGALVALVSLVLGAVLLAGCSALPESGAVHRQRADETTLPRDAPYFNPPGPAQDADPSAIVSGFLLAMQANPLSTSVARRFLSTQARTTWQPNRGTVVYEAFSVDTTAEGTDVRLSDTRRLDGRGGWLGDRPGRTQRLRLDLVSEQGQWRIDNPPDALVVPTSFFDRSFARFDLYFFDQTGRTLVPDPVFIPRGEQSATNLVRGLLAGPGPSLADVSRSALPSGTGLDLSVVVTESGVAEVPLSREVLTLDPGELSRAVDQLAWTLRQVPGIRRVRLTVGGTPVPLPGGRVDAPVTVGRQYDAAGPSGPRVLWGLRAGRVDDLSGGDRTVPGPLGRGGYALRSLAVGSVPVPGEESREGRSVRTVAAVSQDGGTVFVAPAEEGSSGRVRAVVADGTDVLRPSYDGFGDLWLVDRTVSGARVLVVSRGRVREVRVPGVTGADVVAFSVARDGARVAVAYAGSPAPAVRVTDLLRTDEGAVSGAGRSHTIVVGDGPRIVDVGWRDPATIAVLLRPTAETSVVDLVPYDGSPLPATGTALPPSTFRGAAQSLVVSPDGSTPLRLVTPDQRLFTLSSGGTWPRTATRVTAAAYAD